MSCTTPAPAPATVNKTQFAPVMVPLGPACAACWGALQGTGLGCPWWRRGRCLDSVAAACGDVCAEPLETLQIVQDDP